LQSSELKPPPVCLSNPPPTSLSMSELTDVELIPHPAGLPKKKPAIWLNMAITCLSVPSVKRFVAKHVVDGSDEGLDFPEGLLKATVPDTFRSNVEFLRFEGSGVGSDLLESLLAGCEHLKSFEYNHESSIGLNPLRVAEGLLASIDCLESLTITNAFSNPSDRSFTDNDNCSSLHIFPKLTHLKFSSPIIFGTDRADTTLDLFLHNIPRTLKSLKINRCEGRDEFKYIAQLVIEKMDRCPGLETVGVFMELEGNIPEGLSEERKEDIRRARLAKKARIAGDMGLLRGVCEGMGVLLLGDEET